MVIAADARPAVGESVQSSYAPCQLIWGAPLATTASPLREVGKWPCVNSQHGIAAAQERPSDRTNVTKLRLAPQSGLDDFEEKPPGDQYYWLLRGPLPASRQRWGAPLATIAYHS